jgi:hypothetical protein
VRARLEAERKEPTNVRELPDRHTAMQRYFVSR